MTQGKQFRPTKVGVATNGIRSTVLYLSEQAEDDEGSDGSRNGGDDDDVDALSSVFSLGLSLGSGGTKQFVFMRCAPLSFIYC